METNQCEKGCAEGEREEEKSSVQPGRLRTEVCSKRTVLQWGQSPFRGKRVELGSGRSGTVYPSWVFICCVTLSLGALLPG